MKKMDKKRNSLFRLEPIEESRSKLFGDVLIVRPISFTAYTTGSILIVTSIIIFLMWVNYDKKIQVVGVVKSKTGVAKVVSERAGTITRIFVEEGDYIEEGDRIASIGTRLHTTYGSQSELLMKELDSQISLQESSLEANIKALELSKEKLLRKKSLTKKQIKSISEQSSILKNILILTKSDLNGIRELVKEGLHSKKDLNEKYSKIMRLELDLNQLFDRKEALAEENSSIDLEIEKIELEKSIASRNSELRISELDQRRIEVEGREEYIVKAPSAGILSTVLITPYLSIGAKQEVLSIIPINNTWVVELYVPSKAIGNISEGQKVNLKYDGFPHQKYGVYEGRVDTISKTPVITPNFLVDLAGLRSTYRVIVSIERQDVIYMNKKFPLYSGMEVKAELVEETRTLMNWIVGPLIDLRNYQKGLK